MRIKEQEKREYYQKECIACAWIVRQLERQINSFYHERILATNEAKRAEVQGEIQILEPNVESKHLIKDPYLIHQLLYFVHIFLIDVVGTVNSFRNLVKAGSYPSKLRSIISQIAVIHFEDISIQNELA